MDKGNDGVTTSLRGESAESSDAARDVDAEVKREKNEREGVGRETEMGNNKGTDEWTTRV